jgi:putative addiction module antidote
MLALKIRKVGNSAGVVLPAEAMAALRVEVGDTVYLTESPDGVRLTPYDPDFERQTEIMERVARKYRNALRELAK